MATSTPENISQTVSNAATVSINHQLEIAYRWFAVDFFARGLHTLTAVARLPLCQLGFVVEVVTRSRGAYVFTYLFDSRRLVKLEMSVYVGSCIVVVDCSENLRNIGSYTLQLQAMLNESGGVTVISGRHLPSHVIRFSITGLPCDCTLYSVSQVVFCQLTCTILMAAISR